MNPFFKLLGEYTQQNQVNKGNYFFVELIRLTKNNTVRLIQSTVTISTTYY